jgi:hypothetical protein
VAVTVGESKAGLDASANPASPVRSAASEAIGAGEPQVENFEVASAELLTAVAS